mgnify:CR=1 FL=1
MSEDTKSLFTSKTFWGVAVAFLAEILARKGITIDTAGPAGPPAPVLDPASDTGRSNSDGITADTTPTMHVPGVLPGQTITLTGTNTRSGLNIVTTFSRIRKNLAPSRLSRIFETPRRASASIGQNKSPSSATAQARRGIICSTDRRLRRATSSSCPRSPRRLRSSAGSPDR